MNLHRFLPLPKEYDIKEDIVRLDDLFQQVDLVTGSPLSDIYKLSYFMCHFQHDPRPTVASRIQTLTSRTVTTMICIVLFTTSLWFHHFLSNMSSPSLRTRRRSAPRVMTYAVTFRRVLASFPTAFANAAKPPPAVPPKDPKSQALPSKTRYPTHITSEHRRQIGTPAGVVTAANPTGISRKQLFALRVFPLRLLKTSRYQTHLKSESSQ